MMEGIHL